MVNSILGQDSAIPLQYDPSILSPMSRLDSRIKTGLNEFQDFHGRDFWTSYETSWLNKEGIPQNKILNISCLLYTSPSPRDLSTSRMPSSA